MITEVKYQYITLLADCRTRESNALMVFDIFFVRKNKIFYIELIDHQKIDYFC